MKLYIRFIIFLMLGFSPLVCNAQKVQHKSNTKVARKKNSHVNSQKSKNQRLAQMAKDACDAFEKKQYNRAIGLMEEYKKEKPLPSYGYYMLTLSCLKTAQDERCVEYGKEWERVDPNSHDEECRAWIYANIGVGNANLNRFEDSNLYFKRSAELNKKSHHQQYVRDCESIGYNYWSMSQYEEARKWFELSATGWNKVLKISFADIEAGKVNHIELGRVLYDWAMCHYTCGDNDEGNRIVRMTAKCHYEEAEQFCRDHLSNKAEMENN